MKMVGREQILQSNPIFLDVYFIEVLHLSNDSRIVSKKVIEDWTSDTTRIIKLSVTWVDKDGKEYTKKLFFKLPIISEQENAFDQWSRHEIDYYKRAILTKELPIIKCHDAYIFEDNRRFLLMLDDISSNYSTADEVQRNDMKTWLNAADSLAKLHSYYWNGANTHELKHIHGDIKTLDEKILHLSSALDKFLPYVSEFYDKDILNVYESALEATISYERNSIQRREQNNNISVIHGDSHIYNFMFPKDSDQSPLICDFQFWRIGIPMVDIMHLTRVHFPFWNDPDRHLEVLKHYHESLHSRGVTNYNMKECIYDYYLSAAYAVFGPVFNYYDFGLGHEYWGQGVYDTIYNYKTIKKLLF